MNGKDVAFVWVCDGTTFATFVEGQPAPFATGKFEVADGRWKTIPRTGQAEEGPFRFVNADTVGMTGRDGREVVWTRIKAPLGPPPTGVHPPTVVALKLNERSAPPGILDDFNALRRESKRVASAWNSAAEPFRVDLWGAYTNSRFQAGRGPSFVLRPQSKCRIGSPH